MPELPEVEVIRLFLQDQVLDKTISDVEVHNRKSFLGNPCNLVGQTIKSLSRRGKQLSLKLTDGNVLLFHFKMTGQLVYLHQQKTILGHPTPSLNNSSLPNKSTRLTFHLSDGSKLYFNDQRKFGWVKLLNPKQLKKEQQDLGVDILSSQFTLYYFQSKLKNTSRPVKLTLLDQNKFAGVGNIYANDALFLSAIHPLAPSNLLSPGKTKKLYQNIIHLVRESINHGGSTARDNKYIRPDGSFGSHQYHFRVYQKEGEPCPVCQTPIQRIKIANRSSFYCPVCQKLESR